MSQDNQFQHYGYDQYLKAPKKQRLGSSSNLWDGITEKLRSPVVATVALLATGALFTGVIIMAYPSGKGNQAEIPIIKADLSPVKSEPSEPGGMDVPYSDSTVLSSIGHDGQPSENSDKIENLLAQANEDLTSKEEALQRAMGEDYNNSPSAEAEHIPQERGMFLEEEAQARSESDIVPEPDQAGLDVVSPSANGILQKIDPSQAKEITEDAEQKLADTAAAAKPIMHAAATSPETMDFVRSALSEGEEETKPASVTSKETPAPIVASEGGEYTAPEVVSKNTPMAVDEQPSDLEPAAGAASPAINIEKGTYYVQLASITDRSRADKEFAKLQKKFSVLSGLEYRVEEASLEKGTFFRIQAGPFSKDSAKSICEDIKKQKPGGCILVK